MTFRGARQPVPQAMRTMLHFFPRFASGFEDTPFASELRRLAVPHRFFGAGINFRYRSKWALLFVVYPRLFWFALRAAVQSLLLARPSPSAAIIGTDVEALVFGVIRLIFWRRTMIVFESLIITPRRSPAANALYQRYFGLILSLIDVAICHSTVETTRYAAAFPRARCRFAFVPFGTTVNSAAALMAAAATVPEAEKAIVTAGRSGRDYATLAAAFSGLPCRLTIICDIAAPLENVARSEAIEIVRDAFDQEYLKRLADSLFVVVPLAVDDISAGQLVLLQASALGRAVIITRTATTPEYATDGEDALFVDLGDVAQMRAAIIRLVDDVDFRNRLAAGALARFKREHCTAAYVRNLVRAIGTSPEDQAAGEVGLQRGLS